MEIAACPKCGSRNIEMGTMGSGVLFGLTSWKSMCRDCGYQGEPLLFDSETEYQKFCNELKKEIDTKEKPDENTEKSTEEKSEDKPLELSKKDAEVVEYLNEISKEDLDTTEPATIEDI